MTHNRGNIGSLAVIIICATILLLSGIGAWVYVESNKTAQRERLQQQELKQERELKEAELESQKQRNANECRANANPNNLFETALCND